MNQGPVYIGGLSYSGKTQLRLMLSCHPDLSLTRRTYMWPHFYGRFGDLSDNENLARCLDAMFASPGVLRLAPDRARIEREFRGGPAVYGRLFALFHAHHAERQGKRRWGDQLGHVEQYAAPIFAGDPSARMIHMVRDPRTRYAALVAAREGRGRPGRLGWETMQWRRSAGLGLSHRRRYAGRYLVVRYEDLRDATETALDEICVFLDETRFPAMTPGAAASPLDETIWGKPLPAADSSPAIAAFVESQARCEMAVLDYSPGRTGGSNGALRRLLSEPFNRAGGVAWRLFSPYARGPATIADPSHERITGGVLTDG